LLEVLNSHEEKRPLKRLWH